MPKSFVGYDTTNIFYKHFIKLRRVQQQISCYDLQDEQSSYTSVLKKSS